MFVMLGAEMMRSGWTLVFNPSKYILRLSSFPFDLMTRNSGVMPMDIKVLTDIWVGFVFGSPR
jgi:hypothetical protein